MVQGITFTEVSGGSIQSEFRPLFLVAQTMSAYHECSNCHGGAKLGHRGHVIARVQASGYSAGNQILLRTIQVFPIGRFGSEPIALYFRHKFSSSLPSCWRLLRAIVQSPGCTDKASEAHANREAPIVASIFFPIPN